MKAQMLVDMDGVLADVYSQFINFEYRDSGIRLNREEMYGKTEEEAFPSTGMCGVPAFSGRPLLWLTASKV